MAFTRVNYRSFIQRKITSTDFRSNFFHTSRILSSITETQLENAKPYKDIPTVKGRTLKSMKEYIKLGADRSYKIVHELTKEYGPIYKQKMPNGGECVIIANPADFETVFSNESKDTYQARAFKVWSMKLYSEKYNVPDTFVNLEHEDFYRRKDAVKKALMAPKEVSKLTSFYDDITKDLLKNIENSKEGDVSIIGDIRNHFKLWSFECAGATTFHTRLNVLKADENTPTNEAAKKLFHSQDGFLDIFHKLEFTNKKFYQTFPSRAWNDFETTMNHGYKLTKELMDEYGEFVNDKKSELTDLERLTSCITVMRAAIDTTSIAAVWSMTELSKHPEVQEKICDEVKKASPGGIIDGKVLQKLRYTRACLKEVLRLNPVIPFSARELSSDLVVCGYKIPAGTVVVMQTGFVDLFFPVGDAEKFEPERWMKDSECPISQKPHPFHTVQFGHGKRACIGRRLAENELYTLYANIFRTFKVKRTNDDEIKEHLKILLKPKHKVSIMFEKRSD